MSNQYTHWFDEWELILPADAKLAFPKKAPPADFDVGVTNQCLKTGARVYLEQYGVLVAADIYAIEGGNVRIVRYTTGSPTYTTPNDEYITHIADIADAWHREDLGVIVMDKFKLVEMQDGQAVPEGTL